MSPPSLDHLRTASAELLGRRELLERVDRKFVATVEQVHGFVSALGAGYHVLRGGGKSWARYETCYYDTDDLSGFHEHLRGRRPRYKVRVRRHVERRRAFLEVKTKKLGERTEKHRRERDYERLELSADELEFVARRTPFDVERLRPSVWTNFNRATLLGVEGEERLTIDVGLCFERNGARHLPQQLAIIELKQRRCSHAGAVDRALHALGIRERSMSKYCAGVASVHEAARPRYRELLLKRLARNPAWTNI
ncbi:MAG TPA: VTC domain-containing protein [Polyangiaceae bacterium]|nr:VTC domain-containing protein [Polyangiaceae bacterium]